MQLKTLLAALEQPPTHIIKPDPQHSLEPASVGVSESKPVSPTSTAVDELNAEITALAYDSRKVVPGSLFIAEAGYHTDGRLYINDAAKRGAVAALGPTPLENQQNFPIPYFVVEDTRIALANLSCAFYQYPARRLCTIGVTGTNGKTSTCNLISTLFEHAGKKTGLITTVNFRLAGEEWENLARQSTLEALEVQQFLHRLSEQGGTHAVLEATSQGLVLQRLRGCEFDVAVFTNLSHEHLDFHKTMDAYLRAKAQLFEMLDPVRPKGLGAYPIAILNRDDVSYEGIKPYCRTAILDYGLETPAAIRAVDLQLHAHSTRFRLIVPGSERIIETPLVGRFNVSNCLAAIATAYSQGISLDIIAEALANVKRVAGRIEPIEEGQPFSVIVDYAHTPDSLEKVLDLLRGITPGKLILVFGASGERDTEKRPVMGQLAAQMTDFFIITDEDPHEEDPEAIIREIALGAESIGKRQGHDFLCIVDRRQAIATAFARAQAGDTVLLAGKGHEQCMIVGQEKVPWDDRSVAREQLLALLKK